MQKKLTRAEKRAANGTDRNPMRLSRKTANRLMRDSELAPLEVMFANMIFWHKQSEGMARRIQQVMDEIVIADRLSKAELVHEAKELMKTFMTARENAQKCAVDAAPYVHPKLQSIKLEKLDGTPEEILDVTMSLTLPNHEERDVQGEDEPEGDRERAAEEPESEEEESGREYRKDYRPVVPVRRERAA